MYLQSGTVAHHPTYRCEKRGHLRGANEEGEERCAGSGGEPVTFSITLQSGVLFLKPCCYLKNNSAYAQGWSGDARSCTSGGSSL